MADVAADLWTADVVLADGESVLIRPMVPADGTMLRAFHRRQSADSIYRRFFSPKPEMTPEMADYFTAVDPAGRAALAVLSGDELIGWASYERWSGRDDAEVAFMVDDRHHGKGIATLLLEHLAAIARSHGVTRFTAETLADNRPMLAVFSKAGWPMHQRFESGVVDLDLDLTDVREFVDSVERREQRADSKAMARLLLPRTVAMIGATEREGSVGGTMWRHLRRSFTGPLYAVNPNRPTVDGLRAYDTIGDVPDDVSLAIVAVPVEALTDTLHQCIAKHVRGVVIVTDVDGADVDIAAIVASARHSGMRIIGPASMGVASPTLGFQAALVDVALPPGNVAISLQSGSLGGSLLRQAADASLGLSWFVSLGDKSDVSGNDLLQFWADDEHTSVIGMYTESFGNPAKFARIARRVAVTRPIVAVRTGAAAVSGAVEAIYRRAGVIEVPTVTAMLDTVRVFSTQPAPAGPRVAVLTNSRSPGVLARAAVLAAGLDVVAPPRPLDHRADLDDFAAATKAAIDDTGVDAVLVIHAPAVEAATGSVSAGIDAAATASAKPVVAVMLGSRNGPVVPGSRVPGFAFPEQAAAVLGRMWAYSQWRTSDADGDIDPTAPSDLRPDDAAQTIQRGLDDADVDVDGGTIGDGIELDLAATREVLEAYGVDVASATTATTADEAIEAADAIGYPVAMKAHRRRIGRSVQAGVALDLADGGDVRTAFAAMVAALGDDALPVTVQAMVPPGVDVRVRVHTDEGVGPVVEVGLGGVQADVIDPGAQRLVPISRASARQLIDESRVGAALREAGTSDGPLVDVVVRIAQLAFRHTEVCELELNPVIVSDGRCWAVDVHAQVRLAPVPPPLRRLV